MYDLDKYKDRLLRMEVQLESLSSQYNSLSKQEVELSNKVNLLQEVNKFFADTISHKIVDTKIALENLVNQGLSYVFGDSIKIEIQSVFKNNKTQFALSVVKDKVNKGRAEDFGGGVLAVIAFLLKVSAVIITKTERFMIFDESLTFVSVEYQEPLSKFISKLCEQMGFDIVLISHQPKLSTFADVVYNATPSSSGLKCVEVKNVDR